MTYSFTQSEILVRRELEMQTNLIKKGVRHPLNNPLLLGPTGIGKTAIASRACDLYELPLLAINCGENSDPTDVSGVPVPSMVRHFLHNGSNSEREGARVAYMEWVLNRYAAMACVEPSFLFFDDLDKADPSVQGALLGVTANRQFRDRTLHPGTLIMGAGNRLGDDQHANEISESLRTRMTIIEMIPDIGSFATYGRASGEIHDTVLGYLFFKPAHLFEHMDNVPRFPTPRGWWEVSQQFFAYPSPKQDVFNNNTPSNWKGIVERKCGQAVSNDFWAWHEVISEVNVDQILLNGDVQFASSGAERRMKQFAAIYAVAVRLNQSGVQPQYTGLEKAVASLDPEMRVALVVQLKMKVRVDIATMFPKTADVMMSDLVQMGDGESTLVAPKKGSTP